MIPYVVAAALGALLFAAFALLRVRGCDGSACGTGGGCGACPNAGPERRERGESS